jgi:sialate O-acetylesterase
MINDWRGKWMQGNFPFYFVQLATYDAHRENTTKGSKWAELRDAQGKALALPNTGMAVTIDIGDPKDLHPKNKQDVGLRLALNALNKTYGKDIVPCGPLYKSMKVDGDKIVLDFTETGKGIVAKDKYGQLRTFEIAGADKQFKWALAYIKDNKVIVFNPEVASPVAVRYGWLDNAEDANLYNAEGLPASPFRTDNWEELTREAKYQY